MCCVESGWVKLACHVKYLCDPGSGIMGQGRVVQGTEHPRRFVWGHIGRGHFITSSTYTSFSIRTRKKPLMMYSTAVRLTSVIHHDELKLCCCSLRWCKSTSERSYSGWVDFFPADHADRVSENPRRRKLDFRLVFFLVVF
jgi:hypothetical protein